MSDDMSKHRLRSLETAVETTVAGMVIYGLLVVLILAGLFLPPISLGERILSYEYVTIPPQEGKAITLEDGTQLTILPEGIQGKTKIKFSIVPRSSFLEGSAGKDLLLGAENIPPWLVMKSPYYRIQFRGQEPPTRVVVRFPIPGDADPLHTLDLYTWDGEAWEWLPHVIPPGDDFIESSLDHLPQSVVVMQTKPLHRSRPTCRRRARFPTRRGTPWLKSIHRGYTWIPMAPFAAIRARCFNLMRPPRTL